MKTNTLLTILISLLIGGGIGYALNTGSEMPQAMYMGQQMDSMDGMMMDMTSRMNGKTGDELDRIFLEDMIVHHQGAIDMAHILLRKTKRPELVELGNAIITAQTGEIEMMKGWQQSWFSN